MKWFMSLAKNVWLAEPALRFVLSKPSSPKRGKREKICSRGDLILIADRDYAVRIAGEILMNNKRLTTKVSLLHVRFFKFGDKV